MATYSGVPHPFDPDDPELHNIATDAGVSPSWLAQALNGWASLDAASIERLRAVVKTRFGAVARPLFMTIDTLTAAQMVNLLFWSLNGHGWPDRATQDGPAS